MIFPKKNETKMGKKTSIVIATALVLCVLLVSCGGGGAAAASGTFNVNGGSYNSLVMTGNASNGNVTLSGSSGTLTDTYASGLSVITGSYTLTFANGTITITVTETYISISDGTLTASGSGTLEDPLIGTWVYVSGTYKEEYYFNGLSFRFKAYQSGSLFMDGVCAYTTSGNRLVLDVRSPTIYVDPDNEFSSWIGKMGTATFSVNGNTVTISNVQRSDGYAEGPWTATRIN